MFLSISILFGLNPYSTLDNLRSFFFFSFLDGIWEDQALTTLNIAYPIVQKKGTLYSWLSR